MLAGGRKRDGRVVLGNMGTKLIIGGGSERRSGGMGTSWDLEAKLGKALVTLLQSCRDECVTSFHDPASRKCQLDVRWRKVLTTYGSFDSKLAVHRGYYLIGARTESSDPISQVLCAGFSNCLGWAVKSLTSVQDLLRFMEWGQ